MAGEWEGQGMPYERDPVSVRWDGATRRLIESAAARKGQWVIAAVPGPPVPRALQGTDEGGLTACERAYQRSLYWVLKNELGGVVALQREWGPVMPQGRLFSVRASDPATARRAVARKPPSEQWWRNAAEQSGGPGSAKQRF